MIIRVKAKIADLQQQVLNQFIGLHQAVPDEPYLAELISNYVIRGEEVTIEFDTELGFCSIVPVNTPVPIRLITPSVAKYTASSMDNTVSSIENAVLRLGISIEHLREAIINK